MSASPTNASLGLTDVATDSSASAASKTTPQISVTGHEALQALLAFSSLQEQIRQRRARESHVGTGSSAPDVWELEQFVLDEVLQLVAERALAITGADGVAIALAEGDEIICRAAAGEITPDAGMRLDPNSGFSGDCLRSGRIVRCDDTENDPRVNVQACRRLGARSMVAVPLAGQRSVLGLVEAFSSEAYGFNDTDVRSLKLLAELILAAMRPEEEDRLAEVSRRVVAQAEPVKPPEPAHPESAVRELPTPVPSVSKEADTSSANLSAAPLQNYLPQNCLPQNYPVPRYLPEPHPANEHSRPGLLVVLVLGLLAVALGGGVWWKIRQNSRPSAAANVSPIPAAVQPVSPQPEGTPPAADSASTEGNDSAAADPKLSGLPKITGIRHWSSADSSSVVIDLQEPVQYEAHRLSNPERIYFDLHDTGLAPGLFGRTIEVGDSLLVRVRIAQPTRGVSRVVLETTGASNFSVSLESNPYRLVVEVRKAGSSPQPQAKIDLFAPRNPATKPQASAAPPVAAVNQSLRTGLPKFRLVLDAGHGGWDLGTVGRKGLLEKDVVLDIVERLGSLVQNRLGAEIVYTRDDDTYVPLEKRAEIANLAQADLFVSIHANYSASSAARGVETYYSNTYSSIRARTPENETEAQTVSWTNVDIREKAQESRRVAASVQRALYGMLAAKNPGITNRGVKKAGYVVLTGTSIPAILSEVSFVSSPDDERNLQTSAYRQQIAEALYKGIAQYAQESHRVKIASASGKPTGR